MAGYYAISERYVVWSDFMGLPGSVGKDVAYHDLQTGQTTVIEASLDLYQYSVDIWGPYIVWTGSDSYVSPPYHLTLYNIDTEEATSIACCLDNPQVPGPQRQQRAGKRHRDV